VDRLWEGVEVASALVSAVLAAGAEPVWLCIEQGYTAVKVRNERDVYAVADLLGKSEHVISEPVIDMTSDGTTAGLPGLVIHSLTVQIDEVLVSFFAYDRDNDPNPWNNTTSPGTAVNEAGPT
jgi:hypothetical protein